MKVMLTVLGVVTLLPLGVVALRWWATRAIEDLPDTGDDVTDRMSLLPEGHQPPPGLSPLSPSERFLAAETSRGLRELQLFLHDAA